MSLRNVPLAQKSLLQNLTVSLEHNYLLELTGVMALLGIVNVLLESID